MAADDTTFHVLPGLPGWVAGDNVGFATEQSTTEAYGDPYGGPDWKIELSTTADPLDGSPSWTDITGWVLSFATNVGRDDELDAAKPGRGSLLIDDPERDFDPGGNLEPGRRVRITTTAPVTANVFYGIVDDVTAHIGRGREFLLEVSLVDMLAVLAADTVSIDDAVGDGDSTGERIGRVLDAVGIPAGLQDLDDGRSYLTGYVKSVESALSYCNKVVRTEAGRFYAAGDGKITFRERYVATPAVSLTISDATGDTPPPAVVARYGLDRVITVAEVAWDAGQVRVEDLDNIPLTGPRARQFDTLITNQIAAITFGEWMLMMRAVPQRRIAQCSFTCTNDTQTAALLGIDRGDRVTFVRTPDVGAPISVTATVERIAWAASDVRTTCTLGFAPVPDYDVWTWSDAWNSGYVWGY